MTQRQTDCDPSMFSVPEDVPRIDDTGQLPAVVEELTLSTVVSSDPQTDQKEDYEKTRESLKHTIEIGHAAAMDLLRLARESSWPRAYEVLGQMLKIVGDTSDKVMTLHEKVEALKGTGKPGAQGSTTNNIVFAGSTADLQEFMSKVTGVKKTSARSTSAGKMIEVLPAATEDDLF